MARSVHVYLTDHVNVLELRPRLNLDADVVVDMQVDVIGFFIWFDLAAPCY